MFTIYPYYRNGTWMFDDQRRGLVEEAFVLGADVMLTRLVHQKAIPAAERGFTLHFSDAPFEGFDAELKWLRSDDSQVVPGQDGSAAQVAGNWYSGVVAGQEMTGWLCGALGLFYDAAPARIFVKVEPLPAGVDPKWRVRGHAAITRRFVSAPKGGDTDA